MISRKDLLHLGLPVAAGLSLLLSAVLLHRDTPSEVAPPRMPRRDLPVVQESPGYSAPTPTAPAPAEAIAVAVEDSRIRGTYSNYRTAVATGNAVLEESLRNILARDRKTALALAEEELRKASTSMDRDIARKTLESLRK